MNVYRQRQPISNQRLALIVGISGGFVVVVGVVFGMINGLTTPTKVNHQNEPVAAATARPTVLPTVKATAKPVPTAKPALSENAIDAAVVNYQPCPNSTDPFTGKPRVLGQTLNEVIYMAGGKPDSYGVVSRSGDTVRVGFLWRNSSGELQKTVFDYHQSTGKVTGEDSLSQETIKDIGVCS